MVRAFDTLLSPGMLHWPSVAVGLATIGAVLALERTRVGALGLVVAVVATSAVVYVFGLSGVVVLDDLGVAVDGLPTPVWPDVSATPDLILPAVALAVVALVQGAGISANFVNPDGRPSDPSRDFAGQGAANVASGFLQGMPVGGSLSASALSKAAGARSRQAPLIAGLVMVVVIVALGGVIAQVAMPALAGLLILIGVRTVTPSDMRSVWRTGIVQRVVLVVTFVSTMVIPLQYAVLAGRRVVGAPPRRPPVERGDDPAPGVRGRVRP